MTSGWRKRGGCDAPGGQSNKECDTMKKVRACNVSVLRPTAEEMKIVKALRDPKKKERLLKIKEESHVY